MLESTELSQSIAQRLKENTYECMVCHEVIAARHKVWSCGECWAVFHEPCISYWARSSTTTFRCPHCQHGHASDSVQYTCFCGKTVNPEYDPFETPHSCGDTCDRRRKDVHCPHRCPVQCHPGPCPPCPLTRVQSCHCGIDSKSVPCSGGAVAYSCGRVCGKLLTCGLHHCAAPCHSGPCSACPKETDSVCHCGRETKKVPCGGSGHHSCLSPCTKAMDCGVHICTKKCHPGPCDKCPRLPTNVSTCPCGKTPLWKMHFLNKEAPTRTACTDPLLCCPEVCDRLLPCGTHRCGSKCHDGPCPPCFEVVPFTCRCGSKRTTTFCYATYTPMDQREGIVPPAAPEDPKLDIFGGGGRKPKKGSGAPKPQTVEAVPYPYLCTKKCPMKKSCGRHICNVECCNVFGASQYNDVEPDEYDTLVADHHTCTLMCGRKLPCGHKCGSLCHSGACPRCPNVSYSELTCYCGKTVLEPPIPCGTRPPECPHPCVLPRPCGHPALHECHDPSDACPPCAFGVIKRCSSHGRPMEYLMPCHLEHVSCGVRCGKPMPNGDVCTRPCHWDPC
eukprot:PhM_4_TR5913/c0_g1_i1/m.61841/K12236/NFX1; transcriptional repressor NF-X1